MPHPSLSALRHPLGLALLLTAAFAAPMAFADDDDGDEDTLAMAGEETPGFRLHYGAALTSEYIDDGESQSSGNPALQGYVEGSYGMFFGGLWMSTVDFEEGDDNVEFDLYAGIRQRIGDVDVALSYYRYLYDQTGDCCGEIQLEAEYEFVEGFEGEFEASWDPVEESVWTEIGASYEFAPKWTLSSTLGTDFGTEEEEEEGEEDEGGRDTVAMTFGIAREITENSALSLVYHDSNKNPEALVATVSVDF